MPCNTQRAVKKPDFIFLPSWVAFWAKEQAHFVFMKYFKCPSNNLEIVKGFYLLSLKCLFSVEKKWHQQENRDICQGTNTKQTQEKRVKKPSLTWVIRGGWTRGWQWRRGSVLCAGNSVAGWEPGSAPSRCGGTRKADSAWSWKVWRQEMGTGDEYR